LSCSKTAEAPAAAVAKNWAHQVGTPADKKARGAGGGGDE
jgi:hypothetical protein